MFIVLELDYIGTLGSVSSSAKSQGVLGKMNCVFGTVSGM